MSEATSTPGAVATLRLAQFDDPWHALATCLRELSGDARVLVVQLGGENDSDGQKGEHSPEPAASVALKGLARPDLVSVAVAVAPLRGPWLSVALGCDLRVFGPDASISVDAGVFGCLGRLADVIGYPRAAELALTGRRMSATEAAALGLANLVAAQDQVAAAVADLCAALVARPRNLAIEMKAALNLAAPAASDAMSRQRHIEAELAAAARLARENEIGPDYGS